MAATMYPGEPIPNGGFLPPKTGASATQSPNLKKTLSQVKAEKKRQARIAVGLPPEGLPINERDIMGPTLAYSNEPMNYTRSALQEARHVADYSDLEKQYHRSKSTFVGAASRLLSREDSYFLYRDVDVSYNSRQGLLEDSRKMNVHDLHHKWQHRLDAKTK
mmetsp:Transcript_3157/g.5081  ORF Transcript_3157/g.5081 Transcript_3157/m.5081 type:complete len:162 (-) Transcript_3157:78-563(-)